MCALTGWVHFPSSTTKELSAIMAPALNYLGKIKIYELQRAGYFLRGR